MLTDLAMPSALQGHSLLQKNSVSLVTAKVALRSTRQRGQRELAHHQALITAEPQPGSMHGAEGGEHSCLAQSQHLHRSTTAAMFLCHSLSATI